MGLGWWSNAGHFGSRKVMSSGADMYTCGAKCTGSCVGFSVWGFKDCWIYTYLQTPLVTNDATSSKSRACQLYPGFANYNLLEVSNDVEEKSDKVELKEDAAVKVDNVDMRNNC